MRIRIVNLDGKVFEDDVQVEFRRVVHKLNGTLRTIKGWECSVSHPEGGLCSSDPQRSASAAFDHAMDILYDEVEVGTSYNEELDGPRDGPKAVEMHGPPKDKG